MNHARPSLHPYQKRLIRLVAIGNSDKQIATELRLSSNTVKQYVIRLRHTLGGIPRFMFPGLGLLLGIISISDLTNPVLEFIEKPKGET